MTEPRQSHGVVRNLLKEIALWLGCFALLAVGSVAIMAVVVGVCLYVTSR
jgi:hypothetical protein